MRFSSSSTRMIFRQMMSRCSPFVYRSQASNALWKTRSRATRPYVLPVTLARRQLEIDDLFFDARNDDPKIAELCKKVKVVADEAKLESLFPDFYATEIIVWLADGRTLSRRKDIAQGYPETPMGQSNLADKFGRLVGSVNIDRVTPLYQAIENLPGANNIKTFAALMTKSVQT